MNMKAFMIRNRNVVLMVVFGAIGLTKFTENVRTVQVIGLLGSGALFGAALTLITSAFRSKQTKA
jgi:hypothetical protein